MSSVHAVLLEHLAGTGWFARHGEVALTAGLTFCFEKDPAAARAFVKLIRRQCGLGEDELPYPTRWQAECSDGDRGRVDVTGWSDTDGERVPSVLVEAKISAVFGAGQLLAYVAGQRQGLARAGASHGVLVALVPEVRTQLAAEEVSRDLASLDLVPKDQAWLAAGDPAVSVTVISWGEALQAMQLHAGAAVHDIDQLLGACRALQGADVAALTEADLAGGWQGRKDDLRLIGDRVSRKAIVELSLPLAPWQPRAFDGLDGGFRYLAPSDLPNLAVGIRVDEQSPPLWVRWHLRYADLAVVEKRLAEAGFAAQRSANSLWLPLDLAPDTGSATRQIDSLVAQVVRLYKVAVAWAELD